MSNNETIKLSHRKNHFPFLAAPIIHLASRECPFVSSIYRLWSTQIDERRGGWRRHRKEADEKTSKLLTSLPLSIDRIVHFRLEDYVPVIYHWVTMFIKSGRVGEESGGVTMRDFSHYKQHYGDSHLFSWARS